MIIDLNRFIKFFLFKKQQEMQSDNLNTPQKVVSKMKGSKFTETTLIHREVHTALQNLPHLKIIYIIRTSLIPGISEMLSTWL
jgi:hypothetical protein